MNTATDIIKSLRSKGLSQSEIARQAGIPQSRISRWESGKAPVGANDALRLVALLRDFDQRNHGPAHEGRINAA